MNKNNMQDIILDSVADGVFTIGLDMKITSFNRAAEEITNISREDAIGKYSCDIFREPDKCSEQCSICTTLKTGKKIHKYPVHILNGKGAIIPISVNTAVIKDEKGKVLGAVESFRDLSTLEILRKEINNKYTFEDIISKNHEIKNIFDVMGDVAVSDCNVLIEGSSGTGKELFAKAIHNLSNRSDKPYIVVNCGALPDTLLESELFGYVKGAFTDAVKDKPGRFALAEGGTIFLDEIGDISQALQVKLLRVLQQKEYTPLGDVKTLTANVRIVAATNKNLMKLVNEEKFRDDLYYRLNVFKIDLPPLKNRKQDIPLLVDHFIQKLNAKMGKNITEVSPESMDVLLRHDYPGNIRELENIIEHAFVLCHEPIIQPRHFPKELIDSNNLNYLDNNDNIEKSLANTEKEIILNTINKFNGNRTLSAEALGMNKSTLWRKMKKMNITYSK